MSEGQRAVHEAIQAEFLEEGEVAVSWCLVIDVADGAGRHLEHRAGGGAEGEDHPMVWSALGMLEAAADTARMQLREGTTEDDD